MKVAAAATKRKKTTEKKAEAESQRVERVFVTPQADTGWIHSVKQKMAFRSDSKQMNNNEK